MLKRSLIIFGTALIFLITILASTWFLAWRPHFQLNASILPASDDSRSLFVAVNPGFRAEFGDKENPTSAYLRFEVTTEQNLDPNAEITPNLLDRFSQAYQLLQAYHPGISWQLFSVGIDETQVFTSPVLAWDEATQLLGQEVLANQLVATAETDVATIQSQKQNIQTSTTTTRYQGYDQINNSAVAEAVDLTYTVLPGRGIQSQLIIGDRSDFDTACLKLLSVTGSSTACTLPYNRFSFLLELDPSQELVHSPLTIDGGQSGTYYLRTRESNYLLRFLSPSLTDAAGALSSGVSLEIRPGLIGESIAENYYIGTLIADLNWLIDPARVFPVTITTGLVIDGQEFFQGEQIN